MIHTIFFFKLLIVYSATAQLPAIPEPCPYDCESKVYCQGEMLKTVQLAEIHEYPMDFVDKKLKFPEQHILDEFQKLKDAGKLDKESLRAFVLENFAEDKPKYCRLRDIHIGLQPPLLNKIADPEYQKFVVDIQRLWPELAVHVDESARDHPELHSFIYLPKCYIKAGGFFTSQFYWDSNWIVRGLIVTGMNETAKDMLINFFHLIDLLGYIPNASRIYFARRSQPPFLAPIVKFYMDANPQDREFLISNLHRIEREFLWWINKRAVTFTKDNKEYVMYQYRQICCHPRPEGYVEDYKTGIKFELDSDRDYFYTQAHSVAESGMDFSTRQRRPDFYEPGYGSRMNLDITGLVPVELNSLLALNARLLSDWFAEIGDSQKAKTYDEISRTLIQYIDEVFRDESRGAWFDWDLRNKEHRIKYYPTNLSPLYALAYDTNKAEQIGAGAVKYLKDSYIIRSDGTPKFWGVPTSMILSPEQWDYRNSWAPMNSFIIEGLFQTGQQDAVAVAKELAKVWVKTNYLGFQKHKQMFEKYDVLEAGTIGGAGTYRPQIGFGWSNSCLLVLFDLFGDILNHNDYEDFKPDPTGVDTTSVVNQ